MESPQRDPRVGVVLNGRYRITALLGEGGMGLVYRGERLQLGRPVAIKFLHSPYAKSPKYMARFEREARAMSKLSHPYCVSVIDFGVHDEPYIVMDFVTGETLRELLDKGALPVARALQIVRQILAGLAHAHGQGVIHRDIKPGNIMVGEATGMGDHVRIFDFGLAKLHDPEATDHSMATVIGTPAYMSPEQTRAEPIDGRADLYAVGVLLFEMLAGDKPFVADDAYAVIRMQRDDPPPPLRARVSSLSAELEQVVDKALEKEPGQRYQTAAEFAAALDQVPEAGTRSSYVAAEPSALGREGVSSASQPAGSARSTTLALLGLLLVSGVGAFVYFSAQAPASKPPSRDSDTPESSAGVMSPQAPALAVAEPDAGEAEDASVASDAGGELDAGPSWDEQLAAADRALSQSEERQVPELGADAGTAVRTISDVHRLIDNQRDDAAIAGLRQLRTTSPHNPYLPYLLGELYFERGAWADGLAKYREAIRLSDGYKKRATIHKNAIRALADDRTHALAFVLLTNDVGDAAAELLAQSAEHDESEVVRVRAAQVAEALAR